MSTVKIEKHDSVAVLRMTHGISNGVSVEMVEEVNAALDEIQADSNALILAGNEKIFSMGLDLPGLLKLSKQDLLEFYHKFNDMCLRLFTLPMPTGAAIVGHAPAGGAILASCCDFRTMATGKTKMGLTEIWLGVGVPYLAHLIIRQLVGDVNATGIAFTGQMFGAEQCLEMKWVDEIHPPEEVEAKMIEKMTILAALPSPAHKVNKIVRTEAIRERYELVGRKNNEMIIDFWFDPDTRSRLEMAATKF